jgi:O-acetyl-ADP-ribose deacetylase (regulator of RNase III)
LLAEAYRNSLALALKMGLKAISFPSISTGAYGYPVGKASRVAIKAVAEFLEKNKGFEEVRFVLHSQNDLRTHEEALNHIILKK